MTCVTGWKLDLTDPSDATISRLIYAKGVSATARQASCDPTHVSRFARGLHFVSTPVKDRILDALHHRTPLRKEDPCPSPRRNAAPATTRAVPLSTPPSPP